MNSQNRTKKVGKKAEPTLSELEFIYDQIQKGLSDLEILVEMQDQPFLLRTPGFIKRRRKEFDAAKKVLEERVKKEFDPILIERRKEHWDKLAGLAALLFSFWKQYLEHRTSEGSLMVSGEQLGQIDEDLVPFLLDHLQAQFPKEFGMMTDWTDMVNIGCDKGVASKLGLLARRRTFKGKCQICQDWI